MNKSNRQMTTNLQSGAWGVWCRGTGEGQDKGEGVGRSDSSSDSNCSSPALDLCLISSAANCCNLALVLFLISLLLRSLICKYVSFNTGMEHEKHEVVGGEGEEAKNESVLIG